MDLLTTENYLKVGNYILENWEGFRQSFIIPGIFMTKTFYKIGLADLYSWSVSHNDYTILKIF